VVFAAGNAGPDNNTLNPYSVAPWVIGVAAGNKDGLTLADFSSRGVPGDPLYQPTITAPGVGIVAARAVTGAITPLGAPDDISLGADAIRYTHMSGTSMATPHVAGVVALLLQANPALSPDQIRSTLRSTATALPGYAAHEAGAGYVNAFAAVVAVR
jgi:serine protease AprX